MASSSSSQPGCDDGSDVEDIARWCQEADRLRDRFFRHGARSPAAVRIPATSLRPGEPRAGHQGTSLQVIWNEIRVLDTTTVGNHPAAVRAMEAGASPDDLVTAMTAASYETAFRLLFLLSAEHAEEEAHDATLGWTLA